MRRTFAILVVLPLTFALLPLAAVLMPPGTPAGDTTLVLEEGGQGPAGAGGAPAGVAAWDSAEFGERDGALTFRGADRQGDRRGCEEAPQS